MPISVLAGWEGQKTAPKTAENPKRKTPKQTAPKLKLQAHRTPTRTAPQNQQHRSQQRQKRKKKPEQERTND